MTRRRVTGNTPLSTPAPGWRWWAPSWRRWRGRWRASSCSSTSASDRSTSRRGSLAGDSRDCTARGWSWRYGAVLFGLHAECLHGCLGTSILHQGGNPVICMVPMNIWRNGWVHAGLAEFPFTWCTGFFVALVMEYVFKALCHRMHCWHHGCAHRHTVASTDALVG